MPTLPLAPELRELLAGGEEERQTFRSLLEGYHPKEAAEILTCLGPEEITAAMSLLPIERERDMFGYFEPVLQERIVLGSSRTRMKQLLAELPSDERAEFLDGIDDGVRQQLMPLLAREARLDLLRRQQFEDDQVGSIMSTEFCVLGEELTVPRALEELRRQAPTKETIYYSYAMDRDGKLKGFVSLRDLIVADPKLRVGDIMKTEVVSVPITADQEEAARLIREYDLLALPVLDQDATMVGIVTHDDAADIIDEEHTEDIRMAAGIVSVEAVPDEYLATSVVNHFRGRVVWLAILAVGFLAIAKIIEWFGKGIVYGVNARTLAVSFLPLLLATGANVGGQASALVLRALAVRSVTHANLRQVIWKEFRIGLILCTVLSVVVFGLCWAFSRIPGGNTAFDPRLALAIATAVGAHVVTAALLGATIPLLFSRLGWRPEVFSLPALNCVSDTMGTVIYIIVLLLMLR